MKAELVIPKGFRLVKKPKFVLPTFVLTSHLNKNDLLWRDASLEAEAWEIDLYIFIEKANKAKE